MRLQYRLIWGPVALLICVILVPQKLIAHGGDPDLIHACISSDGTVRIVGPDDKCAKSETARHWIRVRKGDKPPRDRKVFGTKLASLKYQASSACQHSSDQRL
jgi:hypothetical protein